MQSATTSAGATALATQYNNLRLDVLLGGDYATSGGSADVQTLSLDAQITSYVNGMLVHFRSGFTTTTRTPTLNINSIGAKTMKKFDRSALFVGEIIANASIIAVYDSTDDSFLILSNTDRGSHKYGDGSDGALSITSGTTTLNESTRDTYQYTSVSITGTGALAIGANHQNKPVYIYVQGDLTVTSSASPAVDVRSRGGAGGTAGAAVGGSGGAGTSGSVFYVSSAGNGGGGGTTYLAGSPRSGSGGGGGGSVASDAVIGSAGSGGGTGGAIGTRSFYSSNAPIARNMFGFLGGGGGGGSGSINSGGGSGSAGGAGGAGGGTVIFIVGGNINITGIFNASGNAGSTGATTGSAGGGGGGGGGGGFIGVFYAGSVTANTATFTVSGGAGGAGGAGTDPGAAGGAGGNGVSLVRKITAGMVIPFN